LASKSQDGLKELFANASNAMFDILIESNDNKSTSAEKTQKRQRTVTVDGKDPEDLMINFLRNFYTGLTVQVGSVSHCKIMRVRQ